MSEVDFLDQLWDLVYRYTLENGGDVSFGDRIELENDSFEFEICVHRL